MSIIKVKEELKEMRKLNRRGIINSLTEKYKLLFQQLPPLEQQVMNECYLQGKSYLACGRRVSYCERQVKRIIKRSIEQIGKREL